MPDAWLDDFLVRALLAGLAVAVAAGPLGCFVVWRRMAYFGAALSHAALLGVAAGVALGVAPGAGILVTCMGVAVALVFLQEQGHLATDTLLGILAHGTLALGLVVLGLMQGVRVDLLGYLFGDILAVNRADLAWIGGGALVALGVLAFLWRPLLTITVHADLARAEGIPVLTVRLAFMLLIAAVIAMAMKIVGVLLIVALLVIPPAAVRPFAPSPEAAALGAAGVGAVSVAGGLGASLVWDTPAGPSIVVVATALFLLSLLAGGRRVA